MIKTQAQLVSAVTALVNSERFNGNSAMAYAHYSRTNPRGRLGKDQIDELLIDIEAGGKWWRSKIGQEIMRQLDANDDKEIDYEEFLAKFQGKAKGKK